MTDPDCPAWMLNEDAAETVWTGWDDLSTPISVEIDDDGRDVDLYEHPLADATTVRLSESRSALTDGAIGSLLEMLVSIHDVCPPEATRPAADEVAVPLLAPSTVTAHRLEWMITDRLSIVHVDLHDVSFAVSATNSGTATKPPFVELTPAQTWLLVRALAAVQRWQFELDAACRAAATRVRTSLAPGLAAHGAPVAASGPPSHRSCLPAPPPS